MVHVADYSLENSPAVVCDGATRFWAPFLCAVEAGSNLLKDQQKRKGTTPSCAAGPALPDCVAPLWVASCCAQRRLLAACAQADGVTVTVYDVYATSLCVTTHAHKDVTSRVLMRELRAASLALPQPAARSKRPRDATTWAAR